MTQADELYELAKWLHECDPAWPLTPQMASQFIIDILRKHNYEPATKVVVGDLKTKWEPSPHVSRPVDQTPWYEQHPYADRLHPDDNPCVS